MINKCIAVGIIFFLHISCGTDPPVDFNASIRPIFNKKCITCHGGIKQSGGFGLVFREDALQAAESGKYAIVPGNPGQSELINRITHNDPELRMPLDAPALSALEIDILKTWIRQGAPWADHWAYIKPAPRTPPPSKSPWIENEIDHFILAKLQENDLDPSPQATKATLLRRVSLDLIGLPPSAEDVSQFEQDPGDQAYENAVDRLLASPHFGEHWASMWLDLARFADSKGYERDPLREMWQYRDWVINAFNDDMPFDQFTIEQLAGDLLPNPRPDQLIATAFHRNTMSNDEGGSDNEEYRVAAVIDRVNTTWEVWQSTTMTCVQCHSHPYEPIRQKEFYQFYSFFNNTSDYDHVTEYPTLSTFKKEDTKKIAAIKEWIIKQERIEDVRKFENIISLKEPKINPEYFKDLYNIKSTNRADEDYAFIDDGGYFKIYKLDLTGIGHILVNYRRSLDEPAQVEIRLNRPDGEIIGKTDLTKTKDLKMAIVPITTISENQEIYFVFHGSTHKNKVCDVTGILLLPHLPGQGEKGFNDFREKYFEMVNADDSIRTPVLIENPDQLGRATHLFERGNWLVPGVEVEPGVPSSWNAFPENTPKNRLGMAEWLVSDENPLTARVMVNRFWAQIFDTGIVETTEDFGSLGAPPSHPELLDWLALYFSSELEWSMKSLLKFIVTSATYQQSSKVDVDLLELDPHNQLLARGPRVRLKAEQIRDQALQVSGLLSSKLYGPSVMPPQPEGIWQNTVYSSAKWETSPGENRYRRGLYTLLRRSSPYPSLMTFDGSTREFCLSRRINTNTPLQALITLNDPVYLEAAQKLAEKMHSKEKDIDDQLRFGFRCMILPEINHQALSKLKELYHETLVYYQEFPQEAIALTDGKNVPALAALTVVANAMLNLDEFITKS